MSDPDSGYLAAKGWLYVVAAEETIRRSSMEDANRKVRRARSELEAVLSSAETARWTLLEAEAAAANYTTLYVELIDDFKAHIMENVDRSPEEAGANACVDFDAQVNAAMIAAVNADMNAARHVAVDTTMNAALEGDDVEYVITPEGDTEHVIDRAAGDQT